MRKLPDNADDFLREDLRTPSGMLDSLRKRKKRGGDDGQPQMQLRCRYYPGLDGEDEDDGPVL